MGTRCGTIDPATVTFIMKKENLTPDQMDTLMNKKSGVLGVSGVSSDFRDLSAAAKEGNERAKLAIDIFCYRVKTYIGSYAAAMNGVDAIVFTGGIGENDLAVRKQCVSGLDFLGISIDDEKNAVRGKEIAISTPESKVKVLVIPTNEELAIARETLKLISNK
jgi:acetate kinase